MGNDRDVIGSVESTVLSRRTYRVPGLVLDAGTLRHIVADQVGSHPRHMSDLDLVYGDWERPIPPTATVEVRPDHQEGVTFVVLEWDDADVARRTPDREAFVAARDARRAAEAEATARADADLDDDTARLVTADVYVVPAEDETPSATCAGSWFGERCTFEPGHKGTHSWTKGSR